MLKSYKNDPFFALVPAKFTHVHFVYVRCKRLKLSDVV